MPDHSIISSQSPATAPAVVNDVMPVQEQLQNEPAIRPLHETGIQFKLSIGAVDDPLEDEADAMADIVMRMPEESFIQRKCSQCEEEEKVHRKPFTSFIQKKEIADGAVASGALASQLNISKGGGSNIDSNTQSFMQSRFGTDFSNVRIHTGGEAVQMNQELNAKAFTVGNNIYFNEGEYAPESSEGKHLLAHELTHTIQQSGSDNIISMARFNIGSTAVNIDYGDVIRHDNPMERGPELERRIVSWTGMQTVTVRELITPLSGREKRWLLYAIDILLDNSALSAAGRPDTFLRLIGHLPVIVFDPTRDRFDHFGFEVLLASGWISALPAAALNHRQSRIARLIELRSGLFLSQQQFANTTIAEIQQRETRDFLTRARQDAATLAPGHIIESHAMPWIQRVIRVERSGQTIRLNANFEISYTGTTETDGRTRSQTDIPNIRQAILEAWTVRFTTGPYINMTFVLNPSITFRHNTAAANNNAWQIIVRQPDRGPSVGTYWLGEISLTANHLLPNRVRVVAHEVYHLFGPFDAYMSPVEGYRGPQHLAVGRSDPRGRPDLLGLTDPVVLESWRSQGFITADQVQQQTSTIPAIWEEEATRILQDMNIAPPQRTPDEREIESAVGAENQGGYDMEQMRERLDRVRRRTQRADESMQWLRQAEEAITIERELGITH